MGGRQGCRHDTLPPVSGVYVSGVYVSGVYVSGVYGPQEW
jgi:hypothetical protein